jgi:hypothetical protein
MSCKINKRDQVEIRDIDGNPNLVGRYRRTRKGKKIVVDGVEIGGEGKNGSSYYDIRLGADGILYCSCDYYFFRGHASNRKTPGTNYLCKHVKAYLVHAVQMISDGKSMDSECIIYNESVTTIAARKFMVAIENNEKVAKTVAA